MLKGHKDSAGNYLVSQIIYGDSRPGVDGFCTLIAASPAASAGSPYNASMVKNSYRIGLVMAIVLGFAPRSWAWIDTGHKIVAMVAWEDLTPKTRGDRTAEAASALMKKDLMFNALNGGTDDQWRAPPSRPRRPGRTWFAIATIHMQATHNHPAAGITSTSPIEDGGKAVRKPTTNAVGRTMVCRSGDAMHRRAEGGGQRPPDNKAIDLCWIEHLVGDVHQPLHAVSLILTRIPPRGPGRERRDPAEGSAVSRQRGQAAPDLGCDARRLSRRVHRSLHRQWIAGGSELFARGTQGG